MSRLRPRIIALIGAGALGRALLALFGAAAFAPDLAQSPWWQVVRLLFIGGAVLLGSSWGLAFHQRRHFAEIARREAREEQGDVHPL